ncbi:MAG: cyclic nucleotide-binding domain-containing protein [Candidatus Latescibacteria bacterium]|nr:cyclic nucleotide-binding domain-containing protein [Candidatus Latescibacterota bacterium]
MELTHIGPAGTVGEMGLVTNMPRCATITAITDVNALIISRGQFTRLLKEDADMGMKIYHNLLQILVTRLRDNNQYLSKSRKEVKQSRSQIAKQIAASTV